VWRKKNIRNKRASWLGNFV